MRPVREPYYHPDTAAVIIRKRLPVRRRKGYDIISRDRVLFHRAANTLNYLDIKSVIVSCGACLDQLEKYHFEQILSASKMMDTHEYLVDEGMRVNAGSEYQYTYHDHCHTPIKQYTPIDVANARPEAIRYHA